MTPSNWIGARLGFVSSLLLLIGCDRSPAPVPAAEKALARVPEPLCEESKRSLEQVQKSGVFEADNQGNATIAEDVWLQLGNDGQQQLATALALHAACSSEQPMTEQTVTIRGESGRTLSTKVLEVGVGAGSLM